MPRALFIVPRTPGAPFDAFDKLSAGKLKIKDREWPFFFIPCRSMYKT